VNQISGVIQTVLAAQLVGRAGLLDGPEVRVVPAPSPASAAAAPSPAPPKPADGRPRP